MKKVIFFLASLLFACNTPYSLNKFVSILSVAKLQVPYSKYNPLYSVKYGEFKDVCHQFFNLQDNRYMAFFMCQEDLTSHRRSELRFKNIFKVSSQKAHILDARLKIFPLNEKKEFTFLQIHPDTHYKPSINKPLLRIVWMKNYHNIKDHLWAVIRLTKGKSSKYAKIDLGKKPKDFFNIKINIKKSFLSVYINDKEKVSNFNVSYWKEFYNYFKAGVYLQGSGCAKVLFDKLEIKESE